MKIDHFSHTIATLIHQIQKEVYSMKKNSLKGITLLLIASFIWGTTFVAQSMGANHLDTFSFNCIRNFIGVFALTPILLWQICTETKNMNIVQNIDISDTLPNKPFVLLIKGLKNTFTKELLIGGLICGTALCLASNFQQLGIAHSTVGKSAFITTLYIVFVPLLGLFLKKKLSLQMWSGIILAVIGLYLLCMKDEVFVLSTGDSYLLLCAFFFAIQITAVDYFAPKVNCVALSMMQFLVTAIESGIGMLSTGLPSLENICDAIIPLLYAGLLSSGIAFTVQIIGQKHLAPSVASLLMSLESVFAALAGWLILKEVLSTKELIGCGLVFVAVLLTQLPINNLDEIKRKAVQ